MVLIIINGCSTYHVDSETITDSVMVERNLDFVIFSEYQNFYVDIQNDDCDTLPESRSGEEVIGVRSSVSSALRRLGVDSARRHLVLPDQDLSKLSSGMLVECHFRHGKRLPMLIRNYNVKSTFITWINIKLIDLKTKGIIGDVEYHRPVAKHIRDVIPRMFQKLLSVEIIYSKENGFEQVPVDNSGQI